MSNFQISSLSVFQKYFAFYGLIRTDEDMLLIDLLILPIRCTYSILGHILFWYQTVQPLYGLIQHSNLFFWGIWGPIQQKQGFHISLFGNPGFLAETRVFQ